MLDLEAKFSPKIIPASVEYPYGKLKPNITPVDNDGTPVAADIGNDMGGGSVGHPPESEQVWCNKVA